MDDFQALQKKLGTRYLGPALQPELFRQYRTASKRLILLDYDGTLVPFSPHPQQARPDAKLLQLLGELSAVEENQVYLVSGRDKTILQDWFGETGMGLIAEHGAWIRESDKEMGGHRRRSGDSGGWELIKPLSHAWKSHLMPRLKLYSDRVPGSFIEEKEFSIAWHYHKSAPEIGAYRAKELIDDLTQFTANIDVQILEGKKVVEIPQCRGQQRLGRPALPEPLSSGILPRHRGRSDRRGPLPGHARRQLYHPGGPQHLLRGLLPVQLPGGAGLAGDFGAGAEGKGHGGGGDGSVKRATGTSLPPSNARQILAFRATTFLSFSELPLNRPNSIGPRVRRKELRRAMERATFHSFWHERPFPLPASPAQDRSMVAGRSGKSNAILAWRGPTP
jgi:trehalose-phosphatase